MPVKSGRSEMENERNFSRMKVEVEESEGEFETEEIIEEAGISTYVFLIIQALKQNDC